jgi:GntR family transcriptional regulator
MVVSTREKGSRRKPEDYRGPVYEWIAGDVASRIVSGEFQPGSPLPSGQRLASEYGVAGSTYTRAARLLRKRGLVIVAPGMGTFVVSPRQAQRSG